MEAREARATHVHVQARNFDTIQRAVGFGCISEMRKGEEQRILIQERHHLCGLLSILYPVPQVYSSHTLSLSSSSSERLSKIQSWSPISCIMVLPQGSLVSLRLTFSRSESSNAWIVPEKVSPGGAFPFPETTFMIFVASILPSTMMVWVDVEARSQSYLTHPRVYLLMLLRTPSLRGWHTGQGRFPSTSVK